MNSNASRPVPPANTGSAFLDWVADASIAITHFERRFDPFFRPPFDTVFRDPVARLVTALKYVALCSGATCVSFQP